MNLVGIPDGGAPDCGHGAPVISTAAPRPPSAKRCEHAPCTAGEHVGVGSTPVISVVSINKRESITAAATNRVMFDTGTKLQ